MKTLRTIALVVLVNTVAGCIPALLTLMLERNTSWSVLLRQCQGGLVYSYCIGTLCFLLIERLARRIHGLRRALQIPVFLAAFVLLAVLGTIPASLLLVALGWQRAADLWPTYFASLRISLAITTVLASVITIFAVMMQRLDSATIELRNRQLAGERAGKLLTEARLAALESRVHPHFLFNTLNSISALIREDPAAAERTVERLAGLLRYSLDSHRARSVPLRQEMRVVGDYLEIERTRFGERLRYTLDVPPELGDAEVPPFVVQTLVENSVKHAVDPSRNGGEIRVAVRAAGEALVLEVSDDGPGFDGQAIAAGHGLDILRDRLAVQFEDAGRLAIARCEKRTVVTVCLPLRTLATPPGVAPGVSPGAFI
jgi:two-component system sensor histidine kinase AlgZ